MYILVQHAVSDPVAVWQRAQEAVPTIPASFKLHHSFPSPDGRKAVCIWEAASIDSLKTFLDPMMGAGAQNQYVEVVNKEGIALPTEVIKATV